VGGRSSEGGGAPPQKYFLHLLLGLVNYPLGVKREGGKDILRGEGQGKRGRRGGIFPSEVITIAVKGRGPS